MCISSCIILTTNQMPKWMPQTQMTANPKSIIRNPMPANWHGPLGTTLGFSNGILERRYSRVMLSPPQNMKPYSGHCARIMCAYSLLRVLLCFLRLNTSQGVVKTWPPLSQARPPPLSSWRRQRRWTCRDKLSLVPRIVPFPMDFHWNCPMGFQWHCPMESHLCDFWCNILP